MGKVHGDLCASVPAAFKLHCSGTEQVPDDTSEPAIVVDVIHNHPGFRGSEVKLLVDLNILGNIPCILNNHIRFENIFIIGDSVAKMQDSIYPGKQVATKSQFGQKDEANASSLCI